MEVIYKNGKPEGPNKMYYENGQVEVVYKNGKIVSGTTYDEDGKIIEQW